MEACDKGTRDHRDLWLPTLILIAAAALAMAGIAWIQSWNPAAVQPTAVVAGEETDPSVGRLVGCILYFILSAFLMLASLKAWAKKPEQLPLPWMLAALGGTMLWVSVGECAWHFGMNVMDREGAVSFVNFPRIESVQGLPLLAVTALILFAGSGRFPLLAYALAFLGNWYGHICMIGAYPIAAAWGAEMDMSSFYRASGMAHAVVLAALGVGLILGKTKRKTKYCASVCLYAALGTLIFGVLMGKT